jgi:hypothetical protein
MLGLLWLLPQFQGTGVSVSIAFPGDVDTPGYARENLTKVCDPGSSLSQTRRQRSLAVHPHNISYLPDMIAGCWQPAWPQA